MTYDPAEALELAAGELLSLAELARQSRLSETLLCELVECGAIEPEPPAGPAWQFTRHVVIRARTAGRLQRDLELDAHAIAVVMGLVERVEALEAELRRLRARAPRLGPAEDPDIPG